MHFNFARRSVTNIPIELALKFLNLLIIDLKYIFQSIIIDLIKSIDNRLEYISKYCNILKNEFLDRFGS